MYFLYKYWCFLNLFQINAFNHGFYKNINCYYYIKYNFFINNYIYFFNIYNYWIP